MGLCSHTAYLGGLKEYCMCPQELRSERQCTKRGQRETERKMQSAKNRLEIAVPPQFKQTSPHYNQTQTAGHIRPNPLKTRQHNGKCRSGELQARGSPLTPCP
jgi:hypothetical protein